MFTILRTARTKKVIELFSAASVKYCKTRNVFVTTEIPLQESKSVRKRLDFTRFRFDFCLNKFQCKVRKVNQICLKMVQLRRKASKVVNGHVA